MNSEQTWHIYAFKWSCRFYTFTNYTSLGELKWFFVIVVFPLYSTYEQTRNHYKCRTYRTVALLHERNETALIYENRRDGTVLKLYQRVQRSLRCSFHDTTFQILYCKVGIHLFSLPFSKIYPLCKINEAIATAPLQAIVHLAVFFMSLRLSVRTQPWWLFLFYNTPLTSDIGSDTDSSVLSLSAS